MTIDREPMLVQQGLSKKKLDRGSDFTLRFVPAGGTSELVRVSHCLGNKLLHDPESGVSCVPTCHLLDVSNDHCFLVRTLGRSPRSPPPQLSPASTCQTRPWKGPFQLGVEGMLPSRAVEEFQ